MFFKFELFCYQCDDGCEFFIEWLNVVCDKFVQVCICECLCCVQIGNFGDCELVGEGVVELCVYVGVVIVCILVGMIVFWCCCCQVVIR